MRAYKRIQPCSSCAMISVNKKKTLVKKMPPSTLANYNNVFVGHLQFEFGMQGKMYKSLLP
jgi:hypothetical protein